MNSMTSNSIDNEMPKNSDNVPPKAEIKASEYHWKYIEKRKKNNDSDINYCKKHP